MVLEDGSRWGEVATPDQWADMDALLTPGGPRRHFWLRARGRSKTTDSAAASLALMLTKFGPGDELVAAAAGKDQAGLIIRKIRGLADRTRELAGCIDIQNYRVITPRTGAVLDVVSSDLATSWGRTPAWLILDEIANHPSAETAERFADSLLTALVKRADSLVLAITTPSSPAHWSYRLWTAALEDPLWRTSVVSGPAPWQSAEELASEKRRLSPAMWRRLFECEWCALEDSVADEAALAECVRHQGPLLPRQGIPYVIGFDLSVSTDHTAVVVAHLEDVSGQRTVVVDRLEAWIPRGGRQVDLSDVEAWIMEAARDYGAQIVGDPFQAASMIQRIRAAGLRVKPVQFTAGNNSKRAQMLTRLVRDRCLDLPDDPDLRAEMLSLRLAEGSTPGTLRLTSDSTSGGHHDRATALMLCAEELLAQPAGSMLDMYGMVYCGTCSQPYPVRYEDCPRCHPGVKEKPAAVIAASRPAPEAGGWAAAAGIRYCDAAGHPYSGQIHGDRCPHCHKAAMGFLGSGGQRGGIPGPGSTGTRKGFPGFGGIHR
jgi:hypothetical protein